MKHKSLPASKNKKATKILQRSLLAAGISTNNSEMNNILTMMEKLLHWAAIIDSSDDAIISKSAEGYITSWNQGAQRLYGYLPEEIIGKPVSILMPPEKKDDFPYIIKQLHEGKRVEHYETKRMTKDGRILDVSITVSPIRDSQGNIIGASKVARDITERVENEKRRDEFVSTASHELKTPITSQKVFGELLEQIIDEEGYTKLKPYIQKINKQTDKMTNLIEDLLELSRVQTARLTIDNRKFFYDDLINEVVDHMQLTTKHKITKKGKTNKYVNGDKDRLNQVLMNLLTNAIKYSPKADEVIITLSVHGSEIITGIKDFGIGIAKEYHHKVFERFFRVTDIDEKTYPGMGIGLFLSHEIVSRHGGKLWVESAKGKGATFYFSLPTGGK
jgi:PAS domain S-box-containing protein